MVALEKARQLDANRSRESDRLHRTKSLLKYDSPTASSCHLTSTEESAGKSISSSHVWGSEAIECLGIREASVM